MKMCLGSSFGTSHSNAAPGREIEKVFEIVTFSMEASGFCAAMQHFGWARD
ncbi:hypothetical protein JOD97_005891 [Duganella sp. 1411]|jgi:hypothetical protein|uniref:hypothetical protein n=1 Tax=Duganella sp. 1411 TaxID=2806572 RepID=UPI001AEA6987|nr:hypothetical protein [Duganella sp. 1411]MBP1207805.1 hypothetical protein [Duganella sp. 1411]